MKFQWHCMHHECSVCHRKAAAVGGLIFRCEMCPRAFCEDHLSDFARDHITNKCARFQECGQIHPTQACFVQCSNRCAGFSALTAGGTDTESLFNAPVKQREQLIADAARAADSDSDELQRKKVARAARIRAEQMQLLARATTKTSASASAASKEGGGDKAAHDGAKRRASASPAASLAASPSAEAGASARKKQRRAEDGGADSRDDLTKLRELYADTLGRKARGALANDAERLATAIVAKQASDAAAATARAQEEAEAKSSAAGGVAATETAWKRMSINSATAKFAMRRRIATMLETGVAPLPLRSLPGAAARVAALSKIGSEYLHSLLFAAPPGQSGAAAEILAWEGIGGDDDASLSSAGAAAVASSVPSFHDARSHVASEIRLSADAKARAAKLFLRLVRQMGATKSEGGLYRRVADEMVGALGLVLDRPSGHSALFAGSISKFAECIAAFLTFPAHGAAQVYHPRELDDEYYDVGAYDAFGMKKVVDCGTQAPTTPCFDPTLAISHHARNAIQSQLIGLPAWKRLATPAAPVDRSIRTQAWGRLAREERVVEAAPLSARGQFKR